ncbi:ArsR/SmtB family transcription factor [Catenulispora pinisilvae]|uniref:ArsR/SmtB family transcription factor n=1 Tax=Catenulispora pinisilvae TaxID=2705253 RepID=UPI0018927314|nr:metalloregulator ArsR/SmtB family transcription factor [Catenulispora pinisilvae]
MAPEREQRNRLGDLIVTDPRMMRALAHPARLAIMDILRREGPSSATELAPRVGISPSAASWHLRHLAGFGLVRDGAPHPDGRARRWESAVRGFRFDLPGDPADAERHTAARALAREMMAHGQAQLAQWLTDVEPGLDGEWEQGVGVANTRVVVDTAELAAIQDGIEELLAPYVNRDPGERPAGSRSVRLLRYALPEARDIDAEPDSAGGGEGA